MDYWNGPLEWTTGPILRVATTFAHAHSPLYLMPNSGLCSLCMRIPVVHVVLSIEQNQCNNRQEHSSTVRDKSCIEAHVID